MLNNTGSLLNGNPTTTVVDRFGLGSLNEALSELESLNPPQSIPPANHYPLKSTKLPANGFHFHGSPTANCISLFNNMRNTSHVFSHGLLALTKENMGLASNNTICGPAFYDCDSAQNPLMMVRSQRHRFSPYHRRKPIYSVSGGRGRSNRVNAAINNCNELYYLRSLRSVNSLPRLCAAEDRLQIPIELVNLQHEHPQSVSTSPTTQRERRLMMKQKTDEDFGSTSFSVPRSKSLEDLRESVKPKPKSLSSDMAASGSISSFDTLSLSPRSNFPLCRNSVHNTTRTSYSLGFPISRRPSGNTNGNPHFITTKDIEIMSRLIGKLDVA